MIVAVVGPTASGKSSVALELAALLGGEIVCVDSMQVYRGMDIGTAKPSAEDRARIPHHLLDLVEPNQVFDAAAFRAAALPVLQTLLTRGTRPILCGGTGFYFNALLRGLGNAPPPEPRLRAELELAPLEQLLDELRRSDPVAYANLDRKNRRRVVRAVEVVRLSGRPFSDHGPDPQRASPTLPGGEPAPWRMFGLLRQPDDLRRRIDERIDTMLQRGLVEETKRLMACGLLDNRTALQAIGYRQVVEYLRGQRSLTDTVACIRQKTRQLAKRQYTWFRHQCPVTWLPAQPADPPAALAQRIVRALQPPP